MPNKPIIDKRFFDQPGFTELFHAWESVFSQQDEDFDPATALTEIADLRLSLMRQGIVENPHINVLESVACRYARIIGEVAHIGAMEAVEYV